AGGEQLLHQLGTVSGGGDMEQGVARVDVVADLFEEEGFRRLPAGADDELLRRRCGHLPHHAGVVPVDERPHECQEVAKGRTPSAASSAPEKKKPISYLAVSGASEPWAALRSMSVPYSARMVPAAAFLESVAPISSRFLAMAFSPSS